MNIRLARIFALLVVILTLSSPLAVLAQPNADRHGGGGDDGGYDMGGGNDGGGGHDGGGGD